jgi:hypothetical protein
VLKVRQDVLAGNKCIFATSCRLCVIFPLITAEKGLYSITDVQIHINISTYIYFSVVHHVRILHKSLSGTLTLPVCFHERDEKNWEGGKVVRVRRPESLGT